jgi:membrane fusion protein, multidrug efflux system
MKIMIRSKKILLLLILAVVAYVAWHTMKHHQQTDPSAQEAILVEVEKVKQGSIPLDVQSVGTLVAARNVQITSEVAGQVETILVHDGAVVKENAPLIQLDDTVNKAKAESDKAALTYSEANYKRMASLAKSGAISQQAIEQALADFKEKKAAAEQSSVTVKKMLLTAPFDGVVGKVNVSPGEYIAIGQQLVALTDIQRSLRVEFSVAENYFSNVAMGQQVTLTTSTYPGKEFYGKVAYVSPTINTQDRTVSIYADVPNEDFALTSGLFMNVTLLMGDQKNVLLVPAVSVIATIDGQQVYKVVDNKTIATPVKIGQRTRDQVQIIEGLKLDDIVITAGQQKLKDGTSVKIKT